MSKHTFDDSIAEIRELHERLQHEREREKVPLYVRNQTVEALAESAAQQWSHRLIYSSIVELLTSLFYNVWDTCAELYEEEVT